MTDPDAAGRTRVDRASTAHLTVEYPSMLEREQIDGVELVLAAVQTGLPFRPNLVVTATPSTAPLIDASLAAIAAALEQHPGSRLISVDVVPSPEVPSSDPPIGRVIVFTYPLDDGLEVMVKKWVFATGAHHLHLAASFLPSQALVVEETFDGIVARLRFSAPLEALQTAAGRPNSEVGVRLDEEASARAGFPLEDLSIVPAPAPASGTAMPIAGIETVATTWGVDLSRPKVLSAVVTRGPEQGFYAAYENAPGVLVLRSSGSSAAALDPMLFEAYPLVAERLPTDAAAWLGASPAFRFGGPERIPMREYDTHVGGAHPDDADPAMAWTETRVAAAGGQLALVHVPGRGLFEAISPEDDVIEIDALPSARLFDLLLRQVDRVLGVATAE